MKNGESKLNLNKSTTLRNESNKNNKFIRIH